MPASEMLGTIMCRYIVVIALTSWALFKLYKFVRRILGDEFRR